MRNNASLAIVVAGLLIIGLYIVVSSPSPHNKYLVSYSLSTTNNQTLGNRIFVAPDLTSNEINRIKLLLEADATNSTAVILSIYKLQ